MVDIGEKIKEKRKEAGLTQSQLAELSGVASITIRQYESGKRQPRLEKLQKIANVFGISISDLIGFPIEKDILDDIMYDSKHAIAFETEEHVGVKSRTAFLRYRKDFLNHNEPFEQLKLNFALLNGEGQKEAVKRVKELAKIPEYQKETTTPDEPRTTSEEREKEE